MHDRNTRSYDFDQSGSTQVSLTMSMSAESGSSAAISGPICGCSTPRWWAPRRWESTKTERIATRGGGDPVSAGPAPGPLGKRGSHPSRTELPLGGQRREERGGRHFSSRTELPLGGVKAAKDLRS